MNMDVLLSEQCPTLADPSSSSFASLSSTSSTYGWKGFVDEPLEMFSCVCSLFFILPDKQSNPDTARGFPSSLSARPSFAHHSIL